MLVEVHYVPILNEVEKIIAFINGEYDKDNKKHLDEIKETFGRERKKWFGLVTVPERVINDDEAIKIADDLAEASWRATWKARYWDNWLSRAKSLRKACLLARGQGNGKVHLDKYDIQLLRWYDDDWSQRIDYEESKTS